MVFENVIEYAKDPSMTLNHTCLRVKDPKKSIAFYQTNFGMKLLGSKDFESMKFSLYFLTFEKPMKKNNDGNPDIFGHSGILELTHNWGSELDDNFKINNGNEDPHRGFGHICFGIDDIEKACKELTASGVSFKKRLEDGRQKDIAFVLDPDGYWIELVQYKKGTLTGYKFNHSMIRIKDPAISLPFFQNVLGMKLIDKSVHENAKFTLYFLGYEAVSKDKHERHSSEGLLELTHNWGTENDVEFKYHNGNDEPQGYGHICITCKEPEKLCQEIESKYKDLTWAPKFNHGKMKGLAFLKDPDNYSIEIVGHGLIL